MKPIIMSTEDVRGILDGRKTMMRIQVKPQPKYFYDISQEEPFRPGDVLWVRETWARLYYVDPSGYTHFDHPMLFYRADGAPDITLYDDNGFLEEDQRIPWRSPVTMPHEAARLFLRVKDVRAERVQDITERDAIREGIMYTDYGMNSDMGKLSVDGGITFHKLKPRHYPGYHAGVATNPSQCVYTARSAFSGLWDARNAKHGFGWGSNPFVWVIEFERTPSGAIGPEKDGTAPNGDKGANK